MHRVWAASVMLSLTSMGWAQTGEPYGLRVDALVEPLGIDSAHPLLSWKLVDPRSGARQTAYRVTVGTGVGKADVWDSGKVESGVSTGVAYGGPALNAMTRYAWQVQIWGQDGKPYPVSAANWWETGLMGAAWQGQWIGHEPAELHAVREANAAWVGAPAGAAVKGDARYDFRLVVTPAKALARATLYTAGEQAVEAWVNGAEVQQPEKRSAAGSFGWARYRSADVTGKMRDGNNVVAVEVTRFGGSRDGRTPMNASLYLLYKDGTSQVLTTGGAPWTAAMNAEGDWRGADGGAGWAAAQPMRAAEADEEEIRPWKTGPVALLRKEFVEGTGVRSARVYATALGAYRLWLNGQRVGDQVLAPGWMDFREHVPYQVYDVTAQVRAGKNVLGAELAPGWYSTPLMFREQGNNYGKTEPAVRAELRVEHADGSVEWVATDGSWKATESGTTQAEIYDGETFDARAAKVGWDKAGFADAGWVAATVVTPKETVIEAQYFQPIREERVMRVKAVTEPQPGVWILDFGQNMSAVPRVKLTGPAGEDVRLRFGEVLNADGTLYTENLRLAKATDHFILAGTGAPEEWQPGFTFHGFRYMEVTGVKAAPTADEVQAVVLHTAAPFETELATGDGMVNKLWENILWGQRSNFVGVPTDCPQRDERLGWSADAQVFWRTATFNMDLTNFSRKYAADLHGTQKGTALYGIFAPGVVAENPGWGAAWSDAGVIVPWTGWVQTGDRRVVDESWEGMAAYLAEIEAKNPDHLWRNAYGAAFGDWLTPTIGTPEDLLATAYWAYDAELMRQMAEATGRTADAAKYGAMFEAVKTAFEKAYVSSDGRVTGSWAYPTIAAPALKQEPGQNAKDVKVETQTGYVLALHMGLLPEALRKPAADRLVALIEQNHWMLGTGFLGTPYLLEVLSNTGHTDVAFRLLLNKEYPSWGYMVEHGATTMWERWNGQQKMNDPSMNSFNHYAYGAVAEWMYRYAAGVDTDAADAGFHTVVLHPNFDARLGSLKFEYETPYGRVRSAWTVTGRQVAWTVTVPANATGRLEAGRVNATGWTLDGRPITSDGRVKADGGMYVLPAGTYRFGAVMR